MHTVIGPVNSASPAFSRAPVFEIADVDIEVVGQATAKQVPLDRIGESSEAAHKVSFLLPGDACFMTGSDFGVDRGRVCNKSLIG